ncbi:hypothetical protein V8E53_004594 [Lactarius tabidus]
MYGGVDLTLLIQNRSKQSWALLEESALARHRVIYDEYGGYMVVNAQLFRRYEHPDSETQHKLRGARAVHTFNKDFSQPLLLKRISEGTKTREGGRRGTGLTATTLQLCVKCQWDCQGDCLKWVAKETVGPARARVNRHAARGNLTPGNKCDAGPTKTIWDIAEMQWKHTKRQWRRLRIANNTRHTGVNQTTRPEERPEQAPNTVTESAYPICI